MTRFFMFFLAAILFLGSALPSLAQQSAAQMPDPVKAQEKLVRDKVSDLLKTLTEREMQHFVALYTNYNMVSKVRAVREDIKGAVQACAKNNKSMDKKLNNKFEKWNKAVSQTMEEADANINNLGLAQGYITQAELKALFAQVDKVQSVNSSRFEKTPVTTPEACEFMMSKMDETQEHMVGLLKTTLVSYPRLREKTQK